MIKKSIIYFDHNATTPLDKRVYQAMLPYLTEQFANPSGIYQSSQQVRGAVEKARDQAAHLFHADPSEIIFTSGGTESNNMAIKGVAQALREKGAHIITSQIEHPSVLNTCKYLEIAGYKVTFVPVDRNGIVDVDFLKRSIQGNTILISIMHANNETGVLQPVEEISRMASEKGVLFHTDAVQSAGKVPIDVSRTPFDLLSISGHKLYGPKGTGVLFIRSGTKLIPLFHGGGQERYRRSGTENVAGIIGMGKACELAQKERRSREIKVGRLRDKLKKELLKKIPDLKVNGHPQHQIYNTLNISIPGVKSQDLLISLDMMGICASAGSACHAGLPEPSHVLKAMNVPEDLIFGTLRISLGVINTEQDIKKLSDALPRIVEKCRRLKEKEGCENESHQD